jgi:hypothetical protein
MTAADGAAHDVETGVWSFTDFDGTCTEWPSLSAMASRYWSDHAKTGENSYGPAQEFVEHFTSVGVALAVEIVQSLVDTAPTDRELDYVGAGPLEDLVSHNGHGLAFVDEVEHRGRRDPRFRVAISGLWLGKGVPDPVRTRLADLGAKLI